jgi:hypothetical protein
VLESTPLVVGASVELTSAEVTPVDVDVVSALVVSAFVDPVVVSGSIADDPPHAPSTPTINIAVRRFIARSPALLV